MKKPWKVLGITLASLLGLILLLGGLLLSLLGPLVRGVVNAKGPELLNTDVAVGAVDINVPAGRFRLRSLRVGQPEGFDGEDLLRLADVRVDVDVGSLASPCITVNEIRVDELALHIIKDTNGVMNVEALAPSAETSPSPPPKEAPPASRPKAVRLESLVLNDLSVRYEDHSLPDKPIDVTLHDIDLELTNLTFDPLQTDGNRLPATLALTARIAQADGNDCLLGAYARLGVLGTNVPAVNAAVRVGGFELKTLGKAVPAGTSQALGGDCIDLEADIAVSATLLDVVAAVRVVDARYGMTVTGSPDKPKVDWGDLAFLPAARAGGLVTGTARNVGAASSEIAGTAVKSAAAVGKGAGRIIGSVGGGLFKTVKSVATGDLKGAGEGLKQSTVGTVGEAVSVVTNTTVTAVKGVGDAATVVSKRGKGWRSEKQSRWETNWAAAREAVDARPYPGADAAGGVAQETKGD